MKLYEIAAELQRLQDRVEWQEDEKCFLDLDTGELLTEDQLDAIFTDLEMDRKARIQWLWKMMRNDESSANALRCEITRLQKLLKQRTRRAEYFEKLILGYVTEPEDFGLFEVKFTTSHPLDCDDEDKTAEWLSENGYDDCLKYEKPTLIKDKVKKLIKSGVKVFGARIANRRIGRVA